MLVIVHELDKFLFDVGCAPNEHLDPANMKSKNEGVSVVVVEAKRILKAR